jgi:hypothetical protein
MVKSFDETLADVKNAVDTVKAWTASERHQYELGRAAGRAEGIREAAALVSRMGYSSIAQDIGKLLTVPPPPAREDADRTAQPLTEIRGVMARRDVPDGSTVVHEPDAYVFRETAPAATCTGCVLRSTSLGNRRIAPRCPVHASKPAAELPLQSTGDGRVHNSVHEPARKMVCATCGCAREDLTSPLSCPECSCRPVPKGEPDYGNMGCIRAQPAREGPCSTCYGERWIYKRCPTCLPPLPSASK